MAGIGIKDLPNPKKGFRPGVVEGFETLSASLAEDRLRADLMASSMVKYPELFDDQTANLIDRLNKGVEEHWPPESLASHQYMRTIRGKVIGNLWPLAEDPDLQPVVRADLMPTGLWVPASDLPAFQPALAMRRLRADLDRKGISTRQGYLFAGLHSEFDIRRGAYDFHYHLVAGGQMALALDELRNAPKYNAPRTEPWEAGLLDRCRVRITRKPLTNIGSALGYLGQSYYPHRPTVIDSGNVVRRSSGRFRIPEPYHSQLLQCMDRWSLSDTFLLMGMRATKQGFIIHNGVNA